MKAAVLYEPHKPLVIEDLKLAPPKAGEVRVKVAANGACHSDLHVMTGDMRMPLPLVLGHEGAGIVVEARRGRRLGERGRPRGADFFTRVRPLPLLHAGTGEPV